MRRRSRRRLLLHRGMRCARLRGLRRRRCCGGGVFGRRCGIADRDRGRRSDRARCRRRIGWGEQDRIGRRRNGDVRTLRIVLRHEDDGAGGNEHDHEPHDRESDLQRDVRRLLRGRLDHRQAAHRRAPVGHVLRRVDLEGHRLAVIRHLGEVGRGPPLEVVLLRRRGVHRPARIRGRLHHRGGRDAARRISAGPRGRLRRRARLYVVERGRRARRRTLGHVELEAARARRPRSAPAFVAERADPPVAGFKPSPFMLNGAVPPVFEVADGTTPPSSAFSTLCSLASGCGTAGAGGGCDAGGGTEASVRRATRAARSFAVGTSRSLPVDWRRMFGPVPDCDCGDGRLAGGGGGGLAAVAIHAAAARALCGSRSAPSPRSRRPCRRSDSAERRTSLSLRAAISSAAFASSASAGRVSSWYVSSKRLSGSIWSRIPLPPESETGARA